MSLDETLAMISDRNEVDAVAGRAEYLSALDLLLDAAFAIAPRDAVLLAGQAWQGERVAIEWLGTAAPNVLDLIESGRHSQSRQERMRTYETLAAAINRPAGGIWPPAESAITWCLEQHSSSRWPI